MKDYQRILHRRLDEANYRKLVALENPKVERFVARFAEHCDPASVFVSTDSDEDIAHVRRRAIETGEERELATPGHTVHFDSYHDQGRDPGNTKYLVSGHSNLGERLRTIDRETGLEEVMSYLRNSMLGKELYVRFYVLGPRDSAFSIHAVNVENGVFGLIRNANAEDDPLIWRALTTPGEVIFSNVLVTEEGLPRWQGDGRPMPERGVNHGGEWWPDKEDEASNPIDISHWNARYTIRLAALADYDPRHGDPTGVPVKGVIYGGRDSDTWVPVEQAFDWAHGIVTKGAALESQSTAATIGAEGVRRFDPMSNIDFVSIPIGRYIQANLDFGTDLRQTPVVFGVNYFIRGSDGAYLNAPQDKHAWLKWMELRVHDQIGAITTPTGLIPTYRDLRRLFKEHLAKEYWPEEYTEQFRLRIPEHLAKIDRIERIYREQVPDTPGIVFELLQAQRERLLTVRDREGDYVSPFDL